MYSQRRSAVAQEPDVPTLSSTDDLLGAMTSLPPLLAAPPISNQERLAQLREGLGQDLSMRCSVPPASEAAKATATQMVAKLGGEADGGSKSWLDKASDGLKSVNHSVMNGVGDFTHTRRLTDTISTIGNRGIDLGIGSTKAAKDMAVGLGDAARHPVRTAQGVSALLDHTPLTLQGGTDLVRDPGGVLEFWGDVGSEAIRPYKESVDNGKPWEAAGRVGFDVLATLGTAGTGAATKAIKGTEIATKAEKGAEVASTLEKGARGVERAPDLKTVPQLVPVTDVNKATGAVKAKSAINEGGVFNLEHEGVNAHLPETLDAYDKAQIGNSVRDYSVANKTASQIDKELRTDPDWFHKSRPMTAGTNERGRTIYATKGGGTTLNPRSPRVLKQEFYQNVDGGQIKVKPDGSPGGKGPDVSKSVVFDAPALTKSGRLKKMDTSKDNEAFKVTEDGAAVPKDTRSSSGMERSAPGNNLQGEEKKAENYGWRTEIMDQGHTDLVPEPKARFPANPFPWLVGGGIFGQASGDGCP